MPFLKNQKLIIGLGLSVIINAFIWLWFIFIFRNMNDLIPLHYTIYFGIDLIGEKVKIFILPQVGLFIIIVNNFLSLLLYHKEKLVSYFLTYSALLCNFFLLLAGYLIVALS